MKKASFYNFYIPIEEKGEFLIYNSLYNKLFVVDHKVGELLCKWGHTSTITDKDLDSIPLDIHEQLLAEEIVIPVEKDEVNVIKGRLKQRKATSDYDICLTILPTNGCNMKCVYCFENASKQHGIMDKLNQERLLEFVQEMIDTKKGHYRTLSVTWFGGEPLLVPHVIESLSDKFANLCKENDLDYKSDIITNGVNLTSTNWDLLSRSNISTAQVTIDGNEELHNKNRPLKSGKNSYQSILNKLTMIPYHMRVNLRVNIDRAVFEKIEDLFDDLERFGLWPQKAKQIQIYFGFKQSYESNKDNKFNYLTLQEFAAVEEKLRKIKLQRYNQWAIKNRRPKSKLAFSYPKLNPLGCKTVNSSSALVVDCNGSISKCWDDCTYDSKSISNINLGYHALKGQKEFIDMLNFNHFDYSEECASCRFLPICESGNCYHRQVEPGQVMPCTSWKFKLQSVLKEQYLCCCDNPDEIQSYEDLFR